jgi:hypothetical protein
MASITNDQNIVKPKKITKNHPDLSEEQIKIMKEMNTLASRMRRNGASNSDIVKPNPKTKIHPGLSEDQIIAMKEMNTMASRLRRNGDTIIRKKKKNITDSHKKRVAKIWRDKAREAGQLTAQRKKSGAPKLPRVKSPKIEKI